MIRNFFARLKMCRIVFSGQWEHWIILNVDKQNLLHLLKSEPYQIKSYFYGVKPFIYFKMVEDFANTIDEVEMLCDQAAFESNISDRIKEMNP